MNSRLLHIFAGIILLATFVQCNDTPLTSEPENETEQNLTKLELLAPDDGSEEATSVILDWTASQGAESYQIQLSADEDFSSLLVDGNADSTQFPVEALPGDASIHWKVRAVADEQTGPWSDSRMFNTGEASGESETVSTTLQSPADGSDDESANPKLTWTTIASASAYNVQIATDANFSNVVVERELETNSFQPSDLSVQQTYYWRVEPIVDGNSTEFSTAFNFTTSTSVALTTPNNGASNQSSPIAFEWEEVANANSYQLQVGTDDTFADPVVDENVTETTYEVAELTNNRTYFWRVRTSSGDEWSQVYSFQTEAAKEDNPVSNGFVGVSGSDFVLDGETIRFAGTNAYYLPSYESFDPDFVDRTLDMLEDAGVTVVRMWAFYDGYDCGWSKNDPDENVIQTAPGEYSEEALRHLDDVIAKGKERGMRFVLAFANYWDELGGVCQYNTWDGAADPSTNMDHFINSENTQKWFRDYISMLINRENTVTGETYKNETAIFSWEIMNEGHYGAMGSDPTQMRDWYQEMAQFIKSEDPNHLVSNGEEGQEVGMNNSSSPYSVDQYSNTYVLRSGVGSSFKLNTEIPEIDYGSAHWYPNGWGFGTNTDDVLKAQRAWVSDHARIAEEIGKPFVLGEYGAPNNTTEVYHDLWNQAEEMELDGSLIWQLTTDGPKCGEMGGNICSGQDAGLFNDYKDHIQNMKNSK